MNIAIAMAVKNRPMRSVATLYTPTPAFVPRCTSRTVYTVAGSSGSASTGVGETQLPRQNWERLWP